MKNLIFLLAIILIGGCCEPDESNNSDIPNCISEIIENSELSNNLKSVEVQEIDSELHYWLKTDFIESDGREFIVNSQCDTICSFCGFCVQAECASDYDESWMTIWEK